MLAKRRRTLLNHGAALAALALLIASPALGQEPAAGTAASGPAASGSAAAPGAAATPASSAPAARPAAQTGVSSFADTLIPGFQFGADLNVMETYATNVAGIANTRQGDWITYAGLTATMNDHSRRVSLDASYSGSVNYYASSQPTQWINSLDAVANVIAIPDYLNIIGKAFAQPVVISSLGVTTANGSVAPNGFHK